MFNFTSWIAENSGNLPFVVAAVSPPPKVSVSRLIESAITAAVIAAAGYFFMVPRVIDGVKYEIQSMQRDIDRIDTVVIPNLRSEIKESRIVEKSLQRQIDLSGKSSSSIDGNDKR